jgi:hypothetical protein
MRSRAVLLLLLVAASTEFFIRGPLRLRHGAEWNDFLSPYIQSRAWVHGINPYNAETLVKLWPAGKPMFTFVLRDAADGTLVAKRGVPSPYPISAFVVLAPLAFLSWNAAQTLWILISLGAVGFVIYALLAIAGVSWRDPSAWAFGAFTLALAPIHTGLATENPAIVVVALCAGALLAEKQSQFSLAGILLASAICLKPQVGLCFLLFFIFQGRRKLVRVSAAAVTVVAALAIISMTMAGTPWLGSYLENSRHIFAAGAINDFTPANPVWFHMVNLQVGLYPLLGKTVLANWCSLLIGAALLCAWMGIAFRSNRNASPMLLLSALVMVSLLPVYHRSYDAALLVFPLAWALLYEHREKTAVKRTLALVGLFLLPGGVFVSLIAERVHLPSTIVNTWWWRSFVMAHQMWTVVILAILLMWTMRRASAEFDYRQSPVANPEELAVAR